MAAVMDVMAPFARASWQAFGLYGVGSALFFFYSGVIGVVFRGTSESKILAVSALLGIIYFIASVILSFTAFAGLGGIVEIIVSGLFFAPLPILYFIGAILNNAADFAEIIAGIIRIVIVIAIVIGIIICIVLLWRTFGSDGVGIALGVLAIAVIAVRLAFASRADIEEQND
jgi:hypothetical protein